MKFYLLRGVMAVIFSFILVAVFSIATDFFLESSSILPQEGSGTSMQWMLLLAFFYRSIYTIFGGYLTAKLAPKNKINYVFALMFLGGIGGVLGLINGWHFGNHWYPILLAITGPVFVWIGGKVALTKKS